MKPDTTSDTRDRLFRAAIEVFAEHGYERATVREICRRADANVAAVNYHFGDKQHLYAAIFDTVFETLRAHRTPFLPPDAPPEQRLQTYIRAFFEELFYCDEDGPDCTHLSAMYLMEMARPTGVLDRVVRDFIAEDCAELQRIIARLLDTSADAIETIDCATSTAGQVLYYFQAQPLIERLHPDLPPPPERLDALVQHVLTFSLGGIEAVRKSRQERTQPT